MNRKAEKLTALSTAALSIFALNLTAARAANYTPVQGTGTTFDKYLILDKDANVPAAEFTFSIASGTPIAASENGMQVLAGPGTPQITNSAVFAPGDTTLDTVQADDVLEIGADEKYAYKVLNVDFSGVTFDEPGIYRYIVSETAQEGTPFVQDSQQKTLDVYVIDTEGSLSVASYVLHTGTEAPVRNAEGGSNDVDEALAKVENKVTGFINRLSSKDLTLTKLVSGNQASHDKYFKFTLNITGAGKGTELAVDVTAAAEAAPLANSATVYTKDEMGEANAVTKLTCDADGAVSQDFYLKHGQSITIHQLPEGASYTVSEAQEDYVSAALNTVDAEHYAANTGTIQEADLNVGFQNTRNGVIPTGIAMSMMPYALFILIGAAGMASMNNRIVR